MSDRNPLLQSHDLVPYEDIWLEHLQPAILQIVTGNRKAMADIIASQSLNPTWDGLVLAMDELQARLDEAGDVLETLGQLPRPAQWHAAVGACRLEISSWYSEVRQSVPLFQAYQTLANSEAAGQFSAPRKTLLAKKLNDWRIAGVNLPAADMKALTTLNDMIGGLEGVFLDNVQAANSGWEKHITDESHLAGLSAHLKRKLALRAKASGRDGWLLTLEEEAVYTDVISQSENRALRQELFTAYSTRASDQGPKALEYDNGPVLEQLLELRQQRAALLGYESHAQYSLQTKMATSTAQVLSFIKSRIASEKPLLDSQAQVLRDAAALLGYTDLGAWDYAYLAQMMGARQSDISEAELSAYFPFNRVLEGLVLVVQQLFGVRLIKQKNFSSWHPDVQLFEVREGESLLGHIFVDPYWRAPKMDGCWTQPARNRRVDAQGRVTLPVAIFHGNFGAPGADAPSMLSHLQLSMLFHEFGHCLQQVLTRSSLRELSGIRGLGIDASEFAGKMLEEWCWSRESLLWIARHYKTDEGLSSEQIDQILDARKVASGLRTADELMRSLFDFELHRTYGDGRSVQEVLVSTRKEVQPLTWPETDRFAQAFDYMVTGYDAGYYAYQWSQSLARQVFERFEHDGVFNADTGQAFREAFYTPGAERPLLESFEMFMGKPPEGF